MVSSSRSTVRAAYAADARRAIVAQSPTEYGFEG
jgi:hypothetical protein